MTFKEIKKYRRELVEIQNKSDDKTRLDELRQLASKVGASVIKLQKVLKKENGSIAHRKIYETQNEITEMEIVQNINDALRTESRINTYKVMIITAVAAVVSAVVALIALLIA